MAFLCGAAAYTRSPSGEVEVLLRRESDGAYNAFFAAAPCPRAEVPAAAAAALSSGTAGLLAPLGAAPEECEAHLRAKLRLGKGVVTCSTSSSTLLLVPARRVDVPTGMPLRWLPATELLPALGGNAAQGGEVTPRCELAPTLVEILVTEAATQTLHRLCAAASAASRSDGVTQPDDPAVPRKLSTDFFMGSLEAALNEELLDALGVSHILALTQDDPHPPSSEVRTTADAMARLQLASEQIGAGGEAADGSGDSSAGQKMPASEGTEAALIARILTGSRAAKRQVAIISEAARAVLGGQAAMLLGEASEWVDAACAQGGCVLLVGALGAARVPVTWIAVALLSVTKAAPPEDAVAQSLGACRKLFRACSVNAQLSLEVQAFLKRQRREGSFWRAKDTGTTPRPRSTSKSSKGRQTSPLPLMVWITSADEAPDDTTRSVVGASVAAAVELVPADLGDGQAVDAYPEMAGGMGARSDEPLGIGEAEGTNREGSNREIACSELASIEDGCVAPTVPYFDNSIALVTNADTPAGTDSADGLAPATPTTWYRCCKCRAHVFSNLMLEPHEIGKGQAAFKYGKRDMSARAMVVTCSSYFLQVRFNRV